MYSQYQKKTEEIKELNEKYKNPKGKQMEMERIYNESKVKHLKETKNLQQLQKKYIDRTQQNKLQKKSSNN